MDAKAKELAEQVLATQQGITPEQLEALLMAGEPNPAPAAPAQTPVEPAPAPAPPAPAAPAAPTAPAPGEPNVLNIIPEKFRANDVPTSLKNITKSYSEMEDELRKQKDEVANLNKLVQSFIEREPAPYAPPLAPPTPVAQVPAQGQAEVDDAAFFEKPTEAVKKIAAQMANAQIVAYHVAQQRQAYVSDFKAQHPDFDNYRNEIMEVLRIRPDLDRDERNLPIVYELGKQRYTQRMASMRRELGLEPARPAGQPAAQTPVDMDAITKAAYDKARDSIIAEITQRRSVQGIQGSGPATSLDARVQPRVKEQPLSEEDKIIQDMLNAGPKKLTLGE
jgi:hypothetical protein